MQADRAIAGRITYVLHKNEEGRVDLVALLDGAAVGWVEGLRTGARMLLGDIRVRDSNLSEGMVREFGTTLRRRGIGTGLLRRFLEEADAAGVAQVWGSVTAVDLGRNPELLGWYTRRGFEVTAPDGKCDPDASHMIIRNRP